MMTSMIISMGGSWWCGFTNVGGGGGVTGGGYLRITSILTDTVWVGGSGRDVCASGKYHKYCNLGWQMDYRKYRTVQYRWRRRCMQGGRAGGLPFYLYNLE